MAKETTGTSGYDSPLFSTAALDSVREFWGYQMKVGQALTEQAVKIGQSWTDYTYHQAQDVAKMSHDYVKQSMSLAEDIRKGWNAYADKVTKN